MDNNKLELSLILATSADRDYSPATRRCYGDYWKLFEAWCKSVGRQALPASTETVLAYIQDSLRRGNKLTTARAQATAIAHRHRSAGEAMDWHKETWAFIEGMQRATGQQPLQKEPIEVAQLRAICTSLDLTKPMHVRTRSILTLGFASSLRRSNLVALDLADIDLVDQGLVIRVRREKTDQRGIGRTIGVVRGNHPETCPVRAVEDWLNVRGRWQGPLYCGMTSGGKITRRRVNSERVASAVKTGIRLIGLCADAYSGHSLRAGFVTAAAENNCNELLIMKQTGHRSMLTLRKYFRSRSPFRGNVSGMIGL